MAEQIKAHEGGRNWGYCDNDFSIHEKSLVNYKVTIETS
jgi:hypothetical protein